MQSSCSMLVRALRAVCLAAILASGAASAELIALPGSTPQHGLTGTPFANPIGFRVQRADGAPIAGARVAFIASGGVYAEPAANCGLGAFGEPLSYCSGTTGNDGTVAFPRFHATYAGDFSFPVTAKLGGESLGDATLRFIADPRGTPAVVTFVSGDGQHVVQGQAFPVPVKLRVTRAGQPVANAQVNISGSIVGPDTPIPFNPASFGFPVNTAADGTASFTLKADGAVGSGELRVEFYDGDAGYISRATGTY